MNSDAGDLMIFLLGCLIGGTVGGCTINEINKEWMGFTHERAIESGDAQYHPTTGKFMFNGELKAEENE